MSYLEKINVFLNKILMIVGSVAVLLLMSLATVNAFLRIPYIKATWRGAYETVGFLGAIVIAFALGYTQKRKDHIVVDILTEKFPKRVNRVLDGINYFITTIFFAIVSWQIFVWGMMISKSGEVSETLKIVFHPFIYSVSFGFAVFIRRIGEVAMRTLQGEVSHSSTLPARRDPRASKDALGSTSPTANVRAQAEADGLGSTGTRTSRIK